MNQLLKRIDEAVYESIAQTEWYGKSPEDIADEIEDQQYRWGEER